MGTDVPGVECYNHTAGHAIPCQCGKFYSGTDCDPPRWFSYNQSVPQSPGGNWNWLNLVDYLESSKVSTVFCSWQFYDIDLVTEELHWIRIGYEDNPDFDPVLSPNRFLCTIGVLFRAPPFLPVAFERKILFSPVGVHIPRNFTWGTLVSQWVQTAGSPGEPPPAGFQTYIPAFCMPGT